MSHQEALLSYGSARLRLTVFSLVKASDILAAYGTSAHANLNARFVCADQVCNATVKLRAPNPHRTDRKKTQCVHFVGRHRAGCNHKSAIDDINRSALAPETESARPTGKSYPTRWTEPPDEGEQGRIQRIVETPTTPDNEQELGGKRHSRKGDGVSESSSQDTEKFARQWIAWTVRERRAERLHAHWNGGGTYETAFYSLHRARANDVRAISRRIFVGCIRDALVWPSGHVLTLAESDASGEELRVFIRHKIIGRNQHGQALGGLLNQQRGLVGRQVFALGTFISTRLQSGSRPVRQLEITNYFLVYIGDQRKTSSA